MDARHEFKLTAAVAVLAQHAGIGADVAIPIDGGVEAGQLTLDGVLDAILDGYRADHPDQTTGAPETSAPASAPVTPQWPQPQTPADQPTPETVQSLANHQDGAVRGPDGTVYPQTPSDPSVKVSGDLGGSGVTTDRERDQDAEIAKLRAEIEARDAAPAAERPAGYVDGAGYRAGEIVP